MQGDVPASFTELSGRGSSSTSAAFEMKLYFFFAFFFDLLKTTRKKLCCLLLHWIMCTYSDTIHHFECKHVVSSSAGAASKNLVFQSAYKAITEETLGANLESFLAA